MGPRKTRRIHRLGLALAMATALSGVTAGAGTASPDVADSTAAAAESTQMRGVWIASVANTDWPTETGLSPQQQRDEYRALLDRAVADKMNSVFVQVRPSADAFWPSPHEPWSRYLTGEQGRDPGYDPMRFLVDEAHARGLQFHAWFNPYRVGDPSTLTPDHPANRHPDWTFDYDGQRYYDPGVPQAREFVTNAIMDAVQRYEVDGVHLDDYFYPYPVDGTSIPDERTYRLHGKDFDNIEDWRRDNVDDLVSELDRRIHQARPDARFGISPFGIWRNASSDPAGSETNGLESYSAIYADTRKWVREGWVDYIAPQVYWPIGHAAADYAELIPWWSQTVAGTDVELYIGQAAYKIGQQGWSDPGQLSSHLTFNARHEVSGDIFFSATSLATNAAEAMARVVADHY